MDKIIRIKIDDPQFKVYDESKSNNVSSFNYKLIDHYKAGKRIFIYPEGTFGGGQIGLLPATYNNLVIKGTSNYEKIGDEIFFDLVVGPEVKIRDKNKGFKTGCLVILVVIIFLGFLVSLAENDSGSSNVSDSNVEKLESPEEIKKEKIKKQFSSWDGSHIKLTRLIKQNLKDPDSYEFIDGTFQEVGDNLILNQTYRAKNSFGGYNVETVEALASIESGDIIQWGLKK